MHVTPYLNFNGCCEEALEFYKQALGATVKMMLRMKDSPEQAPPGMMPPGMENKIMHADVQIGDSVILASDSHCEGQAKFQGFSLTLTVKNEAEADRVFAALANGGQIQMPLAKTFFSPRFGTLADRFGVSWTIYTSA